MGFIHDYEHILIDSQSNGKPIVFQSSASRTALMSRTSKAEIGHLDRDGTIGALASLSDIEWRRGTPENSTGALIRAGHSLAGAVFAGMFHSASSSSMLRSA